MDPFDLLNHVLNFVAPAFWVAVLVTLAARLLMEKRAAAVVWRTQAAINFAVAVLVLALGLWVFGHDGKMASYSAMLLACATSQWLMLRA